ncbi:hypothetical protein QAD02_016618 [Eretmocerus hayati]|uniref:Uncharacterized protein n=1 Tax=Eretmocerus hayati TaxID=131215 RepID=A0ACC2PDE1_9HYME|nr:hypothetical protein QAD02_016618 [Eretmocerus hayati]
MRSSRCYRHQTFLDDPHYRPLGGARDSCGSCESCESRECGKGEEVTSLEEAKNVISALRARQRAQAHQMLAWRRTLKLQEELVARLTREKADQLRSLSSQLLLFESRLCRKQKEIEACLAQRETIILRQQRVIKQLQNKLRLATNGEDIGKGGQTGLNSCRDDSPPCCDVFDRLDSLGDSDSAVVLEEAFLDDPMPPRFRSNITDVTVIRSVSDAVEPASSSKYGSSTRRSCNGLLRRPEVLETVYSVEEDADAADNTSIVTTATVASSTTNGSEISPKEKLLDSCCCSSSQDSIVEDRERQQIRQKRGSGEQRLCRQKHLLHGSFERLDCSSGASLGQCQTSCGSIAHRTRDDGQQAQVTYNRVMSNHRSVTKPKDVKYKRINKAKSKSLEELRGRLRNWVEKGNKIAISLDQSYA